MAGIFADGERDWVSVPQGVPDVLGHPDAARLEAIRRDLRPDDNGPPAAAPPPVDGNGTSEQAGQCFAGLYDDAPQETEDEPRCEVDDDDAASLEKPTAGAVEDVPPHRLRPAQRYGQVKGGEFQFIVRSFAPFDTFGGGFEGDERSFSASLDVSSRITQTINVKPGPNPSVKSKAWSDPSRGYGWFPQLMHDLTHLMALDWGDLDPFGPMEATAIPRERLAMKTVGNDHLINAHYEGAMPLTSERTTPEIDVSTTLVVSREGEWLRIFGVIRGDGFPNVEVLARDSAGTVMFLHGFHSSKGRLLGPLTGLFGEGSEIMGSFTLDVRLDEDGNFGSVRRGKKMTSPDEFSATRQRAARGDR
jgi:hypothetical protein